jgi:nucleotide-binding universal stress UspA family protein
MEAGTVMTIEKLLFVTKFEELTFDAVQSLLELRKSALNHVVFLNVIERAKVAMHRGTGYQKKEELRLREKANIRFIDWAEDLFELGMEVGVYIVVGQLVPEVIKAAKKEEADLIVIGRSQKGVLEQLYSGSDVMELLRRAQTPVLVFKHLADNIKVLEKPFEKPLLAMDWSPASLRAAEYLKALDGVIRKTDVVYVAGEKELDGSSAMEIQRMRKEKRERLDAVCRALEAHGIEAEPHIYIGEPDQELVKAARECQSSLIVLGSSTKASWTERWLGSLPHSMAEKSPYPALIIPPSKGQD